MKDTCLNAVDAIYLNIFLYINSFVLIEWQNFYHCFKIYIPNYIYMGNLHKETYMEDLNVTDVFFLDNCDRWMQREYTYTCLESKHVWISCFTSVDCLDSYKSWDVD